MTKHVVVDLETMGVSPNAPIISIGAVEFKINEDFSVVNFGRAFYRNVDLQSSLDQGMKIDASTIYWWLRQDGDAREALVAKADSEEDKPVTLYTALTDFTTWFKADGIDSADKRIWSRGQDFDIAILRVGYARFGINHPWRYNMARDARTFYDMLGFKPEEVLRPNESSHNALADATWEARAIALASALAARNHYAYRQDIPALKKTKALISDMLDIWGLQPSPMVNPFKHEEPREDGSDEIIRHLIERGRVPSEADQTVYGGLTETEMATREA